MESGGAAFRSRRPIVCRRAHRRLFDAPMPRRVPAPARGRCSPRAGRDGNPFSAAAVLLARLAYHLVGPGIVERADRAGIGRLLVAGQILARRPHTVTLVDLGFGPLLLAQLLIGSGVVHRANCARRSRLLTASEVLGLLVDVLIRANARSARKIAAVLSGLWGPAMTVGRQCRTGSEQRVSGRYLGTEQWDLSGGGPLKLPTKSASGTGAGAAPSPGGWRKVVVHGERWGRLRLGTGHAGAHPHHIWAPNYPDAGGESQRPRPVPPRNGAGEESPDDAPVG